MLFMVPFPIRMISALCILHATCLAQTTGSGTATTSSSHSVFTPNSPSSLFDSLGTGSTETHSATVTGITSGEPTVVIESACYIPSTRGANPTDAPLIGEANLDNIPAGGECFEIIFSSTFIIYDEIFTVAADGSTSFLNHVVTPIGSVPSSSSASSSSTSSGSSMNAGSIVGAVIGSVFGTLLIGATILWIRKQRRSSRASGAWINRPAGWVPPEAEKQSAANQFEMTSRPGV